MHLAHHLALIGSTWHFRLTTPPDLRPVYGKRYLKHSLRTGDPERAKVLACALTSAYWAQFRELRTMHRDPKEEAERIARARAYIDSVPEPGAASGPPALPKLPGGIDPEAIRKYELDHAKLPDGSDHWFVKKSAGPEDKKEGQAEANILNQKKARGGSVSPVAAAPQVEPMRLSEAINWYYKKYENSGKPKNSTLDEYRIKHEEFLEWHGDCQVATVRAHHLDSFRAYLKDEKDNDLPTLRNKLSPIGLLFEELKGSGYYQGDNPARGQVKFTKAMKIERSKKFGTREFSPEQISKIFKPANLKTQAKKRGEPVAPHTYLVPLIQLYTGARVAEVCQLAVADFVEHEGYKCLMITDEGEGQSVKTTSTKRLVPIHKDLLKIGLWDYVKEVRKAGHDRIFPGLFDGANGVAGAQIKAFTEYLKRLGISAERGRLGTHSLRKNCIHKMQDGRVVKERRMQYVGHGKDDDDWDDVHGTIYSRGVLMKELAEDVLPHLKWGLDIAGLKLKPGQFAACLSVAYIAKKREGSLNRQRAHIPPEVRARRESRYLMKKYGRQRAPAPKKDL